ncbi:NUDIX domain-containing protein [Phreatobacter sp.]|uniref:NUDIX domain-containing protein n=1 Tax=Phreatobacter sp. TaxID=1966341 RepID=UPI003F715308
MILLSPERRAWLSPILHRYWRFSRGMTLGVRACVFDDAGRVLLIRHSYTPGWHFPGGGVEVGQTLADALATELKEEANVEITGEARLVGMFLNARTSKRDHVALYRLDPSCWRQPAPPVPNREIVAHGFFSPDALPADISRGTRERVVELVSGAPPAAIW